MTKVETVVGSGICQVEPDMDLERMLFEQEQAATDPGAKRYFNLYRRIVPLMEETRRRANKAASEKDLNNEIFPIWRAFSHAAMSVIFDHVHPDEQADCLEMMIEDLRHHFEVGQDIGAIQDGKEPIQ